MATWTDAVKQMASFYQSNVQTYQGTYAKPRTGRKAYSCPLLGWNVYDDCSGFTSACLQLMGAFPRTHVPTSGYFAKTTGDTAAYLRKAGFTPYPFSIATMQPFDIIAMNGHVEIFAGYVGNRKKSYSWGNIHDLSKGGMPSWYCSDPYQVIWRSNGVNIDTPIQLNMSIQEQMNAGYGTGGNGFAGGQSYQTPNNLQFGYTSNNYPVHSEYDTFTGSGGKTVFELVDDNTLKIGSLDFSRRDVDSSTVVNHTRIFSTNDASIVLDELSLPMDVNTYDNWVGKGNKSPVNSSTNNAAVQPANSSTNKTNS